jgi:hypothetical protein
VAYNLGMQSSAGEVEAVLRVTPVFRKLSAPDLHTIAQAATVRRYDKGQVIFEQDTPSDAFYTIASGRVKIFKMLPTGKDLILEIFGTGDPLGAVAAYDGRPFPASAVALADTVAIRSAQWRPTLAGRFRRARLRWSTQSAWSSRGPLSSVFSKNTHRSFGG